MSNTREPIQHARFIVRLDAGGIEQKDLWDSGASKPLGLSLPWSLKRTSDGIQLVHRSGQAWDVSEEAIGNELPIELPDLEGSHSGAQVVLRLKRVQGAPAAYKSQLVDSGEGKAIWTVYDCSGERINRTLRFDQTFVAKIEDKKIFSAEKVGSIFKIKSFEPGIVVAGTARSQIENKLTQAQFELELTEHQLANLSFSVGSRTWRFKKTLDRNVPKIALLLRRSLRDADNDFFRRVATGISAAVVAFMLLNLISLTEEEEKEKEDTPVAKIVFKKKVRKVVRRGPKKPEPKRQVVAPRDVPPPVKQKVAKVKDSAPAPAPKKVKIEKQGAPSIAHNKKTGIKGDKKPPKVSNPLAQKKNVKPRISKAVRNAQALQKKISGMASGMTSLLAKSPIAGGSAGGRSGGKIFDTQSEALDTGGPAVDIHGKQRVDVGYTQGGTGDATKPGEGVSYRVAGRGEGYKYQKRAGKGDGFVFVNRAGEGGQTYIDDDALTKAEVWEVINRHLSEVRYCYERAIERRPDIEGKLVVSFVIGKRGKVVDSAVKTSTLQDERMDVCVLKRLVKWKFPKPRGKVDVAVRYPFVFKRL